MLLPCRVAAFVIAAVAAAVGLFTAVHCNNIPTPDASLIIQPSQRGQLLRGVGTKCALTCSSQVSDRSLISDMAWYDPQGRPITSQRNMDKIYVLFRNADSQLVLLFNSLEIGQQGNYTCRAKYANSIDLSTSIEVGVYQFPRFTDAPESQYPRKGQDFLVRCVAVGQPTPLIDWFKNGTIIRTKGRYIVENEGLRILNVTEADDGIYSCAALVLETGEVNTQKIKVEVVVPPTVSVVDNVKVTEGDRAVVLCNGTGKPPPTFSWIKQSTRQNLSHTDRFDVRKNTGELIMAHVEFSDNGQYLCVAENTAGKAFKVINVTVLVRPKIFEFLNITTPVGSENKLVCKAQGRPMPEVSLRKYGSKEYYQLGQQLDDKRISFEQEYLPEKGECYGTLIISNASRNDDGLYECVTRNEAGDAFKNGHITIEFAPTFERTRNFSSRAWTWANKPGNLSCIPEAIPNATIVWKLNGRELIDSPNFKINGVGPVSNLIVLPGNDRRLYTKYECIASNRVGKESMYIELSEAKVPGFVSQVKPQTITATTIKFSIEPPPYFDSLPIRSFTVQYRSDLELSWDMARQYTWSFNAPYILENLLPERTYHFRFAASNDVGMGPYSNVESISMPRRSEPAEPKIFISTHILQDQTDAETIPGMKPNKEVIAVSPYADHFELRWNVPNDNGEPIESYLIRYCETNKVDGEWREHDCSEEIERSVQYTSYELSALKPDTVYRIELRASNSIGASSPAKIRVKTARGLDPWMPMEEPVVSNTAIIIIVVVAVLLVVLLVDIVCFCVNRTGVLALLCLRNKEKNEEEDPKLSSEEREPLKPQNGINDGEKHNLSVEFDGHHVYSKTGDMIGRHSAV